MGVIAVSNECENHVYFHSYSAVHHIKLFRRLQSHNLLRK